MVVHRLSLQRLARSEYRAAEFRDVALGQFKAGVGSLLDVESAQTSYSSALSSYISARFSLLTSRVDLIRAVGILNLENAEPTAPLARLP